MATDSSDLSELSSLSSLSAPPSGDESDIQLRKEGGILKFFHKAPKVNGTPKGGAKTAKGAKAYAKGKAKDQVTVTPSGKTQTKITIKTKGKIAVKGKADGDGSDDEDVAPRRERVASPPHEYILADNPDIAFIVMFRNRFADAFPRNLIPFGPQDLERDVADGAPSERAEYFLCALLKLLLNRTQDVKPGHYHRALEEAVQTHRAQWVAGWDVSPLSDGKTFATMTATERLTLLRALVLWAMSSSKTVRDMVDYVYKGKRKEDDSNIHLSVQPWGSDSDKRRYYLVEGRDDTSFRVYRESNPAGFINRTWWSVAGSIDEVKTLIERLETKDGGPKARKLAKRLSDEMPRFEAGEEKRRRREYRQTQRDRFKRPEPGFSLYEGRTRGKRIKYTYSDDEDFLTDSTVPRRSGRHTGTNTPTEPVTTASGRQIRAPNRLNGVDIDASAAVQGEGYTATELDTEPEPELGPRGRPRRSAAINHGTNGWSGRGLQEQEIEYDSEVEAAAENESEPDLGDDEDEDEHVPYEEDEEDDEDEAFDESKDAMLLDEEDEDLRENSNESGGHRRSGQRNSVLVTIPMSAELSAAMDRWVKTKEAVENDDGDATMAGSVSAAQSSDVTATSPQQAVDAHAAVMPKTVTAPADVLVDKITDVENVPKAGPEGDELQKTAADVDASTESRGWADTPVREERAGAGLPGQSGEDDVCSTNHGCRVGDLGAV